jgi:hypothetical protein
MMNLHPEAVDEKILQHDAGIFLRRAVGDLNLDIEALVVDRGWRGELKSLDVESIQDQQSSRDASVRDLARVAGSRSAAHADHPATGDLRRRWLYGCHLEFEFGLLLALRQNSRKCKQDGCAHVYEYHVSA